MEKASLFLQIHPNDNVMVALQPLTKGLIIEFDQFSFALKEDIKAKHKFTIAAIKGGAKIIMYGLTVGKAVEDLELGSLLTTENVLHTTTPVSERSPIATWIPPDVSKWKDASFMGYHRADGSVGTANYWLVFPLVFCENKNIEVIKDAVTHALGYNKYQGYRNFAKEYVEDIIGSSRSVQFQIFEAKQREDRPFKNIDGVKFITHQMGCGGTRQDAQALCGLLAGYLTNPNVAGATILSLGCQNAQYEILESEIKKRDAAFKKPLHYFDQQTLGSEDALITRAIKATIEGIAKANEEVRSPSSLKNLVIGLECGGSDGFSGISANPTLGMVSDMIVGLGGSAVLAEFPELCGVEQDLSNRCETDELSTKFLDLMHKYEESAIKAGSGFDMNPSPGNIKDGLITDAMKSAGAAKKGGTSKIVDVLDYPEKVNKAGLNLLNTPGNDVESTTALAGAGCNIILFTTGLGTPTGNPITPVIKVSSNSILAKKMSDIIDIDTGPVISGESDIKQMADLTLQYIVDVASGKILAKATENDQNDFIPWKRGVSL